MTTGKFSDYRVNRWLNEIEDCWLALHFDNPDVAGAYASEVFGGSYTRMKCKMSSASNRGIYSLDSVLFTGLPAVGITHIAGWDAQYNGNLEWSAPLANPVKIPLGKTYSVPAGVIALSF